MKKAFGILVIGLVLVACKSDVKVEQEAYTITGTVPGVHNGVRAYLKNVDQQRREIIQDSVIVFDEKFTFKGFTERPQLWYLTINSVDGNLPLIIENEDFTIAVNSEDLKKSTVSGSKSNEAFTTYTRNYQDLVNKRNTLLAENATLQSTEDATAKNKIAIQIKNANQELSNYPLDFIKEHPDNYFSLLLLESLITTTNTDIGTLETQFNLLAPELKNLDYGQRVLDQLKVKKMQLAQFSALDVGKIAPDFSAPDPDGNPVTLSDIRGKVTIIDFWASWCGPCRKENPNVVKVYQKYHDKGLEIINVSLDRPGHKEKWLKAIKDDKLTWHHVSHLNYFDDPVAKLYNIRAIPSTYILDASGTIVAKNLRGAALDAKIAELLN